MEFRPFPKLARLNREIIITEKLDGTNAQVYIAPKCCGENAVCGNCPDPSLAVATMDNDFYMFAGSRTRWITPEADNFGFARWVKDNAVELFQLGPGQHFGEWWGGKIQRGYGLTKKRFSLFNTSRWVTQTDWDTKGLRGPLDEGQQYAPKCCDVVPVLYQGPFSQAAITGQLARLGNFGSVAAPGFMNPEGIVVFHTAANSMFKVTLENDEQPKSLVKAA